MRPAEFKTRRVATPDYYEAVTTVHAMGEPYEKFDYIMTSQGVVNALRKSDEPDGPIFDKTPVCVAIDAVLDLDTSYTFEDAMEDTDRMIL